MLDKTSNSDIERAEILMQALPYIQKLKGKTIVIKYGGNAMISDELKVNVIKDIVMLNCIGIRVVVVHGGGPEINNMLNKIGKEGKFINGLRVTDAETMNIVQMVLAGKVNKDIVSLIDKMGGKALGISGIDGGLLKAVKLQTNNDVDLGFVGEISDVDTSLISHSLDGGYIPVISTIALGKYDGHVYNINADLAASKICTHLNAEKLILLTDVPGILTDIKDPKSLISEISLNQIYSLIENGTIKGGMIPKVKCCIEAVESGVKGTHIIDGTIPHSILLELLSKEGVGTMVFQDKIL